MIIFIARSFSLPTRALAYQKLTILEQQPWLACARAQAGFAAAVLPCNDLSVPAAAFASSMITSLAFSLIMYTADAIKNPGIFGNTEASTTLRPRVPWTRKLLSI